MSTDRKKCLICQKVRKGTNKERLRSTREGLQGIGAVIEKLIQNNEIDAVVSRLMSEIDSPNKTNVLVRGLSEIIIEIKI